MDENNVHIIYPQNRIHRKRKRKKHQWIKKIMHTTLVHKERIENGHLSGLATNDG